MVNSSLTVILKMRLLVGYLGERAQNSWWSTSFYEQSSRQFLEPVLTRTSQLARYHGVVEAARRVHDEHLNVGVYHLFRLPEELEQDLHSQVQDYDVEYFTRTVTHNIESATNALKDLAILITPNTIGPKAVGKIAELKSANTLKIISTEYLSAFYRNEKVYPYLVA